MFILNGVLKSVQSKRLLMDRVQKSTHVTHFGTLGTGHYYREGRGGYKNKIVRSAVNLLLVVQNVCINFLRIDNNRQGRFHVLYIEYLKSVLEF